MAEIDLSGFLYKWGVMLIVLLGLLFLSYRMARHKQSNLYLLRLDCLPLGGQQSLQLVQLGKERIMVLVVSAQQSTLVYSGSLAELQPICELPPKHNGQTSTSAGLDIYWEHIRKLLSKK